MIEKRDNKRNTIQTKFIFPVEVFNGEGSEEALQDFYDIVPDIADLMDKSFNYAFRNALGEEFSRSIPQKALFRSNLERVVLVIDGGLEVLALGQKRASLLPELQNWFLIVSKEDNQYSVYWGNYNKATMYTDIYRSEGNTTKEVSDYRFKKGFDIGISTRVDKLLAWTGSTIAQEDDNIIMR